MQLCWQLWRNKAMRHLPSNQPLFGIERWDAELTCPFFTITQHQPHHQWASCEAEKRVYQDSNGCSNSPVWYSIPHWRRVAEPRYGKICVTKTSYLFSLFLLLNTRVSSILFSLFKQSTKNKTTGTAECGERTKCVKRGDRLHSIWPSASLCFPTGSAVPEIEYGVSQLQRGYFSDAHAWFHSSAGAT